MIKKLLTQIFRPKIFLLALTFPFILTATVNYSILKTTEDLIYANPEELPDSQVAIILGARVFPEDNRMSDMLKDRVLTALDLYNIGKVEKILISGDNGQENYDEVNIIKDFVLENGVPKEDVFLDHAGFDTYDSLYRAKEIFKVENAIVVTQAFHLPRAVYIGKKLDMEVYGIEADRQTYVTIKYNKLREIPARLKAFANILFHTKPKYLGDPIPISGSGTLTWD